MDDLLSDFIAETRETLEAIAGEIVAWEANPGDRARLDAVFRFVHTVKGSCGFLDLPRLGRLSHAAEDALGSARDGGRPPDAALVSAVLAVIDRIRDLAGAIESKQSVADDDQALIEALAPGAAPAVGAQPASGARIVARSIRVPVDLLDRMMAGVSDLVLARNDLARRLRGQTDGGDAVARLTLALQDLRDTITRTRMARIDQLFAALPRMVRDLAAELGHEVALQIEGETVEIDREMIEMIRDPLTHIVRNAIDHGIEPPATRLAAGKPRAGRLCVSARQAGNRILIDVSDDGRGIASDCLVARAIAAGVITAERAAGLSAAQRLELIFAPGVSTRSVVTHISGRGVGMDVVRANVERIGGEVSIESQPGQGLHLQLRVPLTLTIIPAMTVSAGGETFAIALGAIEEIVRVAPAAATVERVAGATVATIRGERLPVVDLAALLALERRDPLALLVVLRLAGGGRFAVGVGAVHDHEELVVKPAAPVIMACGVYAGAALPDDNRPMLLLDAAGIAAAAGIVADVAVADVPAVTEDAPVERFQALLFHGLDGIARGVRLSLVGRIEDVAGDRANFAAGRWRLAHDATLLPLFGGEVPASTPKLRVLHLSDGTTAIAYAVASVIDIVEIAAPIALMPEPGPIAGAVRVGERTIELLDPHWLFADAARDGPPPAARRPLALLADADLRWTREVLRPLVEAAGYAVAFVGERDAAAADIVLAATATVVSEASHARVVRLRDTEGSAVPDGSVWRYDRAGLTAVLDKARGGAR